MQIGFNVTFLGMFAVGLAGQPRRVVHYDSVFGVGNLVSTLGAYTIGLGMLVLLYAVVSSWRRGAIAPANPWGAKTLEWTVPNPIPLENFEVLPGRHRRPLRLRRGRRRLPAHRDQREATAVPAPGTAPGAVRRRRRRAARTGPAESAGARRRRSSRDLGDRSATRTSTSRIRTSSGGAGAPASLLLILADASFVAALLFSYFYLRGLNTEQGVAGARTSHRVDRGRLADRGGRRSLSALATGGRSARSRPAASPGSWPGRRWRSLVLLADAVGQVLQLATFPFGVGTAPTPPSMYTLAGANLFHLLLTAFLGVAMWNRGRLAHLQRRQQLAGPARRHVVDLDRVAAVLAAL